MNNSQDKMNNNASGPGDASSEQLQQLMKELSLRPKSPEEQRRYHREMRLKYLLPKALLIAIVVMLAVLAALLLGMPAEFREVTTAEANQFGARVEFRLNRALIGGVSAKLDGRPLYVIKDGGRYYVQVEQNGALTLTAETLLGRTASQTVSITSVDETAPHVVKSEQSAGEIAIYLEDEGGSGVNWAEIAAARTDTGADFPPSGYDEQEGCVYFSIPDGPVRVVVPDNRGNHLSLTMDPIGE